MSMSWGDPTLRVKKVRADNGCRLNTTFESTAIEWVCNNNNAACLFPMLIAAL